ncbi:hypothetical protein ABO04_09945 [Nitrosomonas sp. HPC101]|nr:hypothetical protein [Nitrosomonas sp. HPC101]
MLCSGLAAAMVDWCTWCTLQLLPLLVVHTVHPTAELLSITKVSDWPYSTFHRHVRLGTYEVTYSVSIKQSAAKSLEKIPRPERLRIIEAIDSLKRYPGAGSVLKGVPGYAGYGSACTE